GLVRGELDWIVMKCLEKDRNRRYETANALALDLQRFLHDEPVLACPPSAAYRVKKFVRRHKGPVLATAVIVLALVGGSVGTTTGLLRAQAERDDKEQARQAERRTAYARAIPLAHAEWRAGNPGRAERVLDECSPELRGWEWHYLRRLFQGRQLATLGGH